MKVLVTGGAGFIGSHIVDALVNCGHDVTVLDSLVAHNGSWPSWVPDIAKVHADVRDEDAVAAASDVDAVCHQAARVGLGVDFNDVTAYVADNDAGTASLLRALWQNQFTGRLVVASSMVVYGEGLADCPTHGLVQPSPRTVEDLEARAFESRCPHCNAETSCGQVSEQAPLDPRNVYAATKLHQEHLSSAFARESGASVTALRYHNVYGPRLPHDTPYAGVASIFLSALHHGQAPTVREDGRQLRDFVHVRDVAAANVAALTAPTVSPAYNIASGAPRSIMNLATTLCKVVAPEIEPEVTGEYKLGDVRHIVASSELARREIGFNPCVSFDDGIAELALMS